MAFAGATIISRQGDAAPRLLADLGRAFTLEAAERLEPRLIFSDSFDWALYREGWALEITGVRYRLLDRTSGGILAEAEESAVRAPRFAWEFAAPALRERLVPRLKVRALISLVAIGGAGRRFALRDGHGDLAGLCDLVTLNVVQDGLERPFVVQCSFASLPEDSRLAAVVSGLCEESDWRRAPPLLLDAALVRAGIRPAGYTGKIRVALTRRMTAAAAAREIARDLSATMKANLPGLRRDVDTEFLHDFRVSVRRTRSLLRLLAKAAPDPTVAEFGQAFRSMGLATNELRDLDVTLLKRRDYGALLPPVLQPGLQQHFGKLAERRRLARESLLAYLDGPEFRSVLARWDDFLAEIPGRRDPGFSQADLPVVALAQRAIRRHFRQVIRRGSRIDPSSTDRALHLLRIRCKRLRYALEFFASLFPPAPCESLVSQLKVLQDNLGEFNDLSLESGRLKRILAGMDGPAPSNREAAALGALILHLQMRRERLREEFTAAFTVFAGKRTRKVVEALLR